MGDISQKMWFSNVFWIVLGIQQGYFGGFSKSTTHILLYGEKTPNSRGGFQTEATSKSSKIT